MKYTAIAFGPNKSMISEEVATTDPQTLAESLDSTKLGGFPQRIIVVAPDLDGGPPLVIHRYERGRDYSERVESLDAAVETIKTWIDNLDEPEAIAELLQKVTGAMDVRIIGEGDNAKIAYDIPYNKE